MLTTARQAVAVAVLPSARLVAARDRDGAGDAPARGRRLRCGRGGAGLVVASVVAGGTGLAVRVVLVAGVAALLCGLWMGQALAAPVGAANEAGVSPAAAASGRLSASGYHSCAIKTDGTPVCWGDNGDGGAERPAGAGGVAAVRGG